VSEPVTLAKFFESLRGGVLIGIRCTACGTVAIPPKAFCTECGTRAWEPVTLGGDGTVESFTVIRVAPRAFAAEAPYALASVRLTEGPSLLGRVVDVPFDTIDIGMAVRFRPLVSTARSGVAFGPA
jgi:uncharacterized OB-fold protein